MAESDAASAPRAAAADTGGEGWVVSLGNYLSRKEPDPDAKGWAVSLGTYLKERQPGPWSIIANEKPQDPLALRLGTFLNETKPIPALHRDDTEPSVPSEPIVLRLGNYLNGTSGMRSPACTICCE